MVEISDAEAKRRYSVCVMAGAVLAASLALGIFTGIASADEHRGEHWNRGHHHEWHGGYYRAPPVVYGSPYYAPYYAPPVIYGPPGIGLNLNFR